MSKEELLKCLIAEIDLIMHDKDYRFENQDGTWYSRESCRDLTNEEVFEELKGELRQLADLEAKLAESENKHLLDEKEWQDYCAYKIIEPQIKGCLDREREYKQQLAMQENTITNLVEDNRASQEWYKKQLEEKEEEINVYKKYIKVEDQDKISFCIEQLEKVKEWVDEMFNGWETNKEVNQFAKDGICLALENVGYKIDNQIAELKKGVE